MEQFKVFTPRTRKARLGKQIEQTRLLIETNTHKVKVIERYLRMYKKCMTENHHLTVAGHLHRTVEHVRTLNSELCDLLDCRHKQKELFADSPAG